MARGAERTGSCPVAVARSLLCLLPSSQGQLLLLLLLLMALTDRSDEDISKLLAEYGIKHGPIVGEK